MTLSATTKRIMFVVLTMLMIFFVVSPEVLRFLGNFALGWAIADISFMLFKEQ